MSGFSDKPKRTPIIGLNPLVSSSYKRILPSGKGAAGGIGKGDGKYIKSPGCKIRQEYGVFHGRLGVYDLCLPRKEIYSIRDTGFDRSFGLENNAFRSWRKRESGESRN